MAQQDFRNIQREEQFGVLDIARDAAMFSINPINHFMYNPNAWDVGKGQIRLPSAISGAGMQRWAKRIRRIPKVGSWVVDNFKQATGIHKLGGFMSSREVYIGAAPWKSSKTFGYSFTAGSKYKGGSPPIPDLVKTGTKNMYSMTADAVGDKYASNVALKAPYRPGTIGPMGGGRFPVGPDIPLRTPRHMMRAIPERVAGVTTRQEPMTNILRRRPKNISEYAFRTGEKVGRATAKTVRGLTKAGKFTAKYGTKIGLRGLALAGKGFAYYQIASLMYSAMSYVFEPLGRSAVQTLDNTLSFYENIPKPELGGQLSMTYLTMGAATERQRALAAISKSNLNARSALGQEAQYLQ